MLELIFTACLVANPDQCRSVTVTLSEDSANSVQCSMGLAGRDQLTEWISLHPDFRIARWSCAPTGTMAKL